MHSFQWVQGALGIIVGLGMTRIIVSIVNCIIGRTQIKLDWVPFAWAGTIFILLLQFSWGLVEIEKVVPVWTFAIFICLLIFILNLFLAGAMILPNSESQAGGDLRVWYERQGRWAMPFLILYVLLAYVFNWYFLDKGPASNPASALFAVLALTAFISRSRRVLEITTVLSVLVSAGIFVEMLMAEV